MMGFCLNLGYLLSGSDLAPVGYWHFNEGNGKSCDSGKNFALGLVIRESSATRWVPGKSGTALHFGGDPKQRNNSGAAVVKIPPGFFVKPFSFEMWLKLDKKIPFQYFRDFVGNSPDRGPGFRFFYYYNKFVLRSGDGKTVSEVSSKANIELIQEAWNFIVVVYDGKSASIHLNGNLIANGNISMTSSKKSELTFGAYDRGFAYPANAAIDEIKLYDFALTHEQIIQTYLETLIK